MTKFAISNREYNDTPCWEWLAIDAEGYGSFWFNGRGVKAHRFIYEYLIKKIEDGKELDHLCRNRNCVNPLHLEEVTTKENILRGFGPPAQNRRRTHCRKGHAFSKENTYLHPSGSRRCKVCNHYKLG